MDEIEAAVHELGSAFAAGLEQPGSMQAVVTDGGYRGQTYDVAGNRALIGYWGEKFRADLVALSARVRSREGSSGVLVVEVAATRTGDYVVSYSGDLPSLPARVVFDDGYRYPAVEERLGVRLPEDLRALYRTIHDDNCESGLLGRFSPAPLEQVVTWYQEGGPGSPRWYGSDDRLSDYDPDGLFEYDPVVFESHPYGHVRRLSGNDWWVTFAPDYGGNDPPWTSTRLGWGPTASF